MWRGDVGCSGCDAVITLPPFRSVFDYNQTLLVITWLKITTNLRCNIEQIHLVYIATQVSGYFERSFRGRRQI